MRSREKDTYTSSLSEKMFSLQRTSDPQMAAQTPAKNHYHDAHQIRLFPTKNCHYHDSHQIIYFREKVNMVKEENWGTTNNIEILLLKLICGDNRFLRLVFLFTLIFRKHVKF